MKDWRKKINHWLYQFYKWRYRHVSNENYMAVLSVIIGIISGLVAVTMKNFTHFIEYFLHETFIRDLFYSWYFVFPLIGLGLTILIIKYVIRRPVDDGIPVILEAIAKFKSLIPRYHTYASLLTAPVTVGFGGSAGLEGPSALTGGAIGSNLAKMLHLNLKQRNLLIAAATAATFSSIFKAPVAGILFVMEVLSFDLTMTAMIPLILASVAGVLTSYFFLGKDILLHFNLRHSYHLNEIPYYILLGITSATTSIYFVKAYFYVGKQVKRFKKTVPRWLAGGIALGILVYFLPALYGEGYDIINHVLVADYHYVVNKFPISISHNAMHLVILVFVLLTTFKVVGLSLTLHAGGVGGVFAPSMFTGALSGYVLALILNMLFPSLQLPPENFALVGMAGAIAGIIQAPLMAVFLIMEITGGQELIVPLMIVAAISFLITHKVLNGYSLYTLQLKGRSFIPTHNKDRFAGFMVELPRVVERDFIPVEPGWSLGDMVQKAVKQSHRNIFPVVDEENHFLGMITLDDIRQIMFDQSMYDKIHVRDLMHKAPTVIRYKKDDFQAVMKKFQQTGAWNLPIIDDQGRYVGFMSKSKLLSIYRKKLLEITSE